VIPERSPRSDVSARNQLTGRVTTIQPEVGVVRVTMECGFSLSALTTKSACDELRLGQDSTVTAAIKATATSSLARPLRVAWILRAGSLAHSCRKLPPCRLSTG
jgi:molybdopterin-binding protein